MNDKVIVNEFADNAGGAMKLRLDRPWIFGINGIDDLVDFKEVLIFDLAKKTTRICFVCIGCPSHRVSYNYYFP